jgi:hypothetical protein
MGQYWVCVNLDKREFVHPDKVSAGRKLCEQLDNHPGPGAALVILCAAEREERGGGDLELKSDVAKRTIGRWAGDRIAFVGDYAERGDLREMDYADEIYALCLGEPFESGPGRYLDISEDVCAVLEHELRGKFEGEPDSWRHFVRAGEAS